MAIINCTVERNSRYKMYIEYSYTQNTSTNQSTISHSLKIQQLTDDGDFNGKMSVTYYVAGEAFSYSDNVNMDDKGNAGYTITIKSGTTIVSHNSDGTKTIAFSCSGNCDSGGWGPGNISLNSTNITLTTIPRASSITSALSVNIGDTCNIKWTPASSSYTYKLKFTLGKWNHTTEIISPNSTTSYTYTDYVLPLSVANQLPSETTGIMTVYLYTYSGSTQIGSTASKTFTVTVPSTIIPTLSDVSATIVNENSVINGWGVAVAGYTKVKISASASGTYGSTISGFAISGGYSANPIGKSLSYTGAAISSSGNKIFTVVAKDSRGRSSESFDTSAITFYAYSAPKVSSFTVARSSSNAKQIVVRANWTYSSVNGNNVTTATLYYKKSSDINWSTYGTISKNTDITLTTEFEENSSYNFKIVVKDSLSKSAQEEGFVSTIEVTMDFRAGGKGIGIGKIAESDNLEVAFDALFMGDVKIKIPEENVYYSLLGAAQALSNSYSLITTATPTDGWTINEISSSLFGNCLRVHFDVIRDNAIGSGNLINEQIMTININHGGKISKLAFASHGAAAIGSVASFYQSNLSYIDNESLQFKVGIGATGSESSSFSAYFILPVSLNLNAFCV